MKTINQVIQNKIAILALNKTEVQTIKDTVKEFGIGIIDELLEYSEKGVIKTEWLLEVGRMIKAQ